MLLPEGAFSTFIHLGVCMAAMVLRSKQIPPQVLLTVLGVPERKVKIQKHPLSKTPSSHAKFVNLSKRFLMIFCGRTLTWWAPKWPKSQKNPSFIVKNGRQTPPQNHGGFCCIFGFFLSFFVFLFLLISCCFVTSETQKQRTR